jgi:hypothetical protein
MVRPSRGRPDAGAGVVLISGAKGVQFCGAAALTCRKLDGEGVGHDQTGRFFFQRGFETVLSSSTLGRSTPSDRQGFTDEI